jgi:hypothetical protein
MSQKTEAATPEQRERRTADRRTRAIGWDVRVEGLSEWREQKTHYGARCEVSSKTAPPRSLKDRVCGKTQK